MQPSINNVPAIMRDVIEIDAKRDDMTLARPFEYSATVLCKSPRQVQLERRHKDEIPQGDFFDNWYSFFGNAVHEYLEKKLYNNDKYLVERRLIRFDKPAGGTEKDYRRVGAKFDAYDKQSKTLYDHKTITTFMHGKEMKDEWVQQLMINAYFLEKEGYEVKDCTINAIYCDWRDSRLTYAQPGDYPEAPCAAFSCKAWSMSDRENLYLRLLKSHVDAENVPDDLLPYCEKDYCWETPAVFAVYRPNATKAIKLCSSKREAEDYIRFKNLTGDVRIQERAGTRRRCEKYCRVSQFCNQYKDWLAKHSPSIQNNAPQTEEPEAESV